MHCNTTSKRAGSHGLSRSGHLQASNMSAWFCQGHSQWSCVYFGLGCAPECLFTITSMSTTKHWEVLVLWLGSNPASPNLSGSTSGIYLIWTLALPNHWLACQKVPYGRVVRTDVSGKGHEMYCIRSGGHGFEPRLVQVLLSYLNQKD